MHHSCCTRRHVLATSLPGQTPQPNLHHTRGPQENHRHSGIGLHTPASVHYGTAVEIRERRSETLDAAYAANPRRFGNRRPSPPRLPTSSWINKPTIENDAQKKS